MGKPDHEVRLVSPLSVKPFVKWQKNDSTDAQAISEAARHSTMRFVAVKGAAQQATGMLFRRRDLLVRQWARTINALRGHLAAFGVVAAQGPAQVIRLAAVIHDPESGPPELVCRRVLVLLEQITVLDKELAREVRDDEDVVRQMSILGVGPVTARAFQASTPPMDGFRVRPRLLGLAWACAAPALDRGKARRG